jgi:hypothetical protein
MTEETFKLALSIAFFCLIVFEGRRLGTDKPGLLTLLRRAAVGALGLVCNVPRLRAACVDFARGARADLAGMWAALRREP